MGKISEQTGWTIAYRTRCDGGMSVEGHFTALWDVDVSWAQAYGLAAVVFKRRPDLSVYYTSSQSAEVAGKVHDDDRGNILDDDGERVDVAYSKRLVDLGLTWAEIEAEVNERAAAWYASRTA